jgi:hypothetical protein
MVGVFSSSSPPKDVYDFYANNSSLHPTDKSSIGVGSNFVGRMRFSGTYTGSLTVVGRDTTTYLVVDIEMSTGNQTTTTT